MKPKRIVKKRTSRKSASIKRAQETVTSREESIRRAKETVTSRIESGKHDQETDTKRSVALTKGVRIWFAPTD